MRRFTTAGPLAMLLAAGFAAPVGAEEIPRPLPGVCCPEHIDMIPEEILAELARRQLSADKSLTIVPVEIDPLGADPMTPWTVHFSSLRVRAEPTTSSAILGSLSNGTQVSGIYNLVVESDEEWIEIEWEGGTGHISRTGVYRIHPANLDNIAQHTNIPYGEEIVNRWWGVPISYEPDDLAVIPAAYTNRANALLREEVLAAAIELIDALRTQDGLDMVIGSPYRSGPVQQSIYNNNVNNSGLNQRFSAPPGHSEHQLGSTMDFTRVASGRFLRNTDPEYLWLAEHGEAFGFRQSYTADNINETGYIEEPWHWRYWGAAEEQPGDIWLMY